MSLMPISKLFRADAEAVLAGLRILFEQIFGDQRDREAVHRALGDAEALGHVADADLELLFGKRLHQADGRGDRRQAAGIAIGAVGWHDAYGCSALWTDVPRNSKRERGGRQAAQKLQINQCFNRASWPDLSRPSTSWQKRKEDVDAGHKAGHHGAGFPRVARDT